MGQRCGALANKLIRSQWDSVAVFSKLGRATAEEFAGDQDDG